MARFLDTGAYLWSKALGGGGIDVGHAVAVDSTGNVTVTGAFRGTANFGGTDLTAAGGYDIFVARFDADGVHMWSKRYGGAGDDVARGLAADSVGGIVVTGGFQSAIDFGGDALTSAAGKDVFIASLTAGGGHVWSRSFGASSVDHGHGVAVDSAGRVVVAGSISDATDFGGGPVGGNGNFDGFVASFSP